MPLEPPTDGPGWTELTRSLIRDEARLAQLRQQRDAEAQTLEAAVALRHGWLHTAASPSLRVHWRMLPLAVREGWRAVTLAAGCFALGAVIGWQVIASDPSAVGWVLPPDDLSEVARRLDDGAFWMDDAELATAPARVVSLFVHNGQLALLIAGVGVLLGIGTLAMLVHNGVVFGALAALVAGAGQSTVLWAFLLPHAVLELPAIFLAGGAGLTLGGAVLQPRPLEALMTVAPRAVRLTAASLLLLAWAAVVEGAISPLPLPRWTVAGIATVNLALVLAWLRAWMPWADDG